MFNNSPCLLQEIWIASCRFIKANHAQTIALLSVISNDKISFDFENVKSSVQQGNLPMKSDKDSVSDNWVDIVMYQHESCDHSAEQQFIYIPQVEMKSLSTTFLYRLFPVCWVLTNREITLTLWLLIHHWGACLRFMKAYQPIHFDK